jgi:predicted acyl esterase
VRPRSAALLVLAALTATSCSDDQGTSPATSTGPSSTVLASEPTTVATTAPEAATGDRSAATWTLRPGVEQLAILDAEPGTELTVSAADDEPLATGVVDGQGSLLFRSLPAGADVRVTSETEVSADVTVLAADDVPSGDFYADQSKLPAGGFGYVTVRDGTTLSANVVLPGPADEGPYPTVVEYSGYAPSNPSDTTFAELYNALGFAYVGVNMRGTGCSGGSFRFFELAQSIDGYDVIEAIAAQPWVLDNEVGMVGISYPGISQLFVAATQPPSLNSITPLSVLADSYRSTLYPGGILNTGFAVEWTQQRVDQSKPYGQGWEQAMVDDGDDECEQNQSLRGQNPDLVAEIDENPFYANPLGDSLAPITFVDRIEVPVFLAGAWQDEQTGGQFATMLDRFTGTDHLYVTLTNGLHTDSLSPPVFARYAEFLQLYVGKTVPDLAPAQAIAPVLGGAIYGVETFRPMEDRFTGMSYDEALAAFESEPSVRVLVDHGAAEGFAPGTPEPAAVLEFSSWPIPEAETTRWLLDDDGALITDDVTPSGESAYNGDPDALPATFFDDDGPGIWDAAVQWDWRAMPEGSGLGFVTAPLEDDVYVAGSGSADLWVTTDADDADLEVTITEVRPDGTEVYVQSGWLRLSQRALADDATELWPRHTNAEADAAPVAGEVVAARVEIHPFAHAFRAGSRLRLTIDAPGNNRAEWEFRTIEDGDTEVTVLHDAEHPSSIVLSTIPAAARSMPLPPAPPACGSLRGQPCRDYVPASNGG